MSTLEQIRRLVLTDRWDLTGHALAGLQDGEYGLDDIERVLLDGSIRKTETDDKREAVDGKKHAVEGNSTAGIQMEVVCKIVPDDADDLLLIITAYERT